MSSDQTHRIKTEIAELLDSNDQQWVTAISMLVDVMYQQFIRERQETANNAGLLEKKTMVGDRNTVRGHKRGLSRAA